MATGSTISETLKLAPDFQVALRSCVTALRRMANYELADAIDHRMTELGERKEFLSPEEHDLLVSLVDFAEQRTIEKLEAQFALK